jgi:hypothetical protein
MKQFRAFQRSGAKGDQCENASAYPRRGAAHEVGLGVMTVEMDAGQKNQQREYECAHTRTYSTLTAPYTPLVRQRE